MRNWKLILLCVGFSGCSSGGRPLLFLPISFAPADLVSDYKREVAVQVWSAEEQGIITQEVLSRLSVVDASGAPVQVEVSSFQGATTQYEEFDPAELILSLPALSGWYEVRLDTAGRELRDADQYLPGEGRVFKSRVSQQSRPIVRRVRRLTESVNGAVRDEAQVLVSEPVLYNSAASALSGVFSNGVRLSNCQADLRPAQAPLEIVYACTSIIPPGSSLRLVSDTFRSRDGNQGVSAMNGSTFDVPVPMSDERYTRPY